MTSLKVRFNPQSPYSWPANTLVSEEHVKNKNNIDVDEAELDAELEALGEEVELGSGGWEAETMGETPSFLQGEGVPDFVDEAPLGGHKVREAV